MPCVVVVVEDEFVESENGGQLIVAQPRPCNFLCDDDIAVDGSQLKPFSLS